MPIFQEPFAAFVISNNVEAPPTSPRPTLQLLALSAACVCAAAVTTGCSDAAVQADREQQKIESSPEFKRKQREAAERGIQGTTEALEGMAISMA